MTLFEIKDLLPGDLFQLLQDRADTAGLTILDVDVDGDLATITVRIADHIRDDVYVVDLNSGDWWLE